VNDDTIKGCANCDRLRSELLDVAVAANAYYEADYTGKVRAPTVEVVKAVDALARKAEEIDEAVIFMRTRGFVGPMLAMCKHVLKELDALCKAKNDLIDERDVLLRTISESFLSLHAPHSKLAFDGRRSAPPSGGPSTAAPNGPSRLTS